MKRRSGIALFVPALVLVAISIASASSPMITGQVAGIELCPQVVCRSAIFAGVFHGAVDTKPTKGSFSVSVTHDPLPSTPGAQSALTGGTWFIGTKTAVFYGAVIDGTITNNDAKIPNTFVVTATLQMDAPGTNGTLTFTGLLNHNDFPPTITGTISQP